VAEDAQWHGVGGEVTAVVRVKAIVMVDGRELRVSSLLGGLRWSVNKRPGAAGAARRLNVRQVRPGSAGDPDWSREMTTLWARSWCPCSARWAASRLIA
jgi:hypothetical protein